MDSAIAPPAFPAAESEDVAGESRRIRKSWPQSWRKAAVPGELPTGPLLRPALWSRPAFELSDRESRLFDLWARFGETPETSLNDHAGSRKGKKTRRPAASVESNGAAHTADPSPFDPLVAWLGEATRSATPVTAAELLILCDVIEQAGASLPDDILMRVWGAGLAGARELAGFLKSPGGIETTLDRSLIVRGELAWKAGLLFGLYRGLDELCDTGREFLCSTLREHTDEDGIPDPELRQNWPGALFPMIRAAAWGDAFRTLRRKAMKHGGTDDSPLAMTGLFLGDDGKRLAGLVRSAIMQCRGDGRLAFVDSYSAAATLNFLESAADAAALKKRSRPRLSLEALREAGVTTGRSSRDLRENRRLTEIFNRKKRPVFQSDDSLIACLRTDWSPTADQLIVDHGGATPRISLCAKGIPVLEGTWDIEVRLDGQPVTLTDSWKSVCWFSDDDGDYFEIQHKLSGGVNIERQMLLPREGRFAVFADCISGAGSARIDYRASLPSVAGTVLTSESTTRECRLTAVGRTVRVFPAALPSDRVQGTPGSFEARDGRFHLTQVAIGGMFAPIVLDWNARRTRAAADWRTLTVAENMRVLKSDEASGHRVRIGDHQILMYRAVKRSEEMRTVLGLHTPNETVIGLFDEDGDLTPLVMVE